jgi:hypothetical protein
MTSPRRNKPRKARRSGRGRHRMVRLAALCAAVLLAAGMHDPTGYGLAAAVILGCIFV